MVSRYFWFALVMYTLTTAQLDASKLAVSVREPIWAILSVLVAVIAITCVCSVLIQRNEMRNIMSELQRPRVLRHIQGQAHKRSWVRVKLVELSILAGSLGVLVVLLVFMGPSYVVLSVWHLFVALYRTASWTDYLMLGLTYAVVLYCLHECLSQLIQLRRRKLVRVL